MAVEAAITLRQSNDETLELTITPQQTGASLAAVTELRLYLKDDACTSDAAAGVLVLSSTDPAELLVTYFSATEIRAEAYIPASALAQPYDRWWRLDALAGTDVRTALYGPVTLVDL